MDVAREQKMLVIYQHQILYFLGIFRVVLITPCPADEQQCQGHSLQSKEPKLNHHRFALAANENVRLKTESNLTEVMFSPGYPQT